MHGQVTIHVHSLFVFFLLGMVVLILSPLWTVILASCALPLVTVEEKSNFGMFDVSLLLRRRLVFELPVI